MHSFHNNLAEAKSNIIRPEREGPAQHEFLVRDKTVKVPKVYEF